MTVARTDDGRLFFSDRMVPRRVTEKGSRIYVVCCIHGWSILLWAHSKGGGSTKTVEYRTVSGRVVHYRENVIFGSPLRTASSDEVADTLTTGWGTVSEVGAGRDTNRSRERGTVVTVMTAFGE